MSWYKTCFLSICLLVTVHGDDFTDLYGSDPFSRSWNFHTRNLFPEEVFQESESSQVETVTPREREPLAPDYNDPKGATEDKPVLQPKPQRPAYNPSILPDGVVDVEATGQGAEENPLGIPGFESSFGGNIGGLFNFGDFFGGFKQLKPWWQGPNVCIEREEFTDDDDEDDSESESQKNQTERVPKIFHTAISLSNCHETANKYECITKINNHGVVKTLKARYKCCYGFERTAGSECLKKVDLKPIMDTINDLGAKEFADLVKSTGLEQKFADGNFTVFVPTDEAFNEFTEKMVELNDLKMDVSRRRRAAKVALSSPDMVLSHTIPGFIEIYDLYNEQLLSSENNNSTIRINIYPTLNNGRLVTANCAKVTKPNNLAKNGIAHLIEGVAVPATRSLQEIIQDNPKLTSLKQLLENNDYFKNFKDNHYTVFAPTDEAFNKLDAQTKEKLLKGDSCLSSIIKHHITSHTICSSAIIGNATTHNIEGDVLNMERTVDGQLILENKAKITETDIIATNGVIHLIDTILIPESAFHLYSALVNENITKFHDLIEKSGLGDEIDNLQNSTLFAPSNEAFDDPKTQKLLETIGDDKEKLKDLILYHVAQGQLQSCDMNNNVMLKSNSHDQELRLNLYSTLPLFSNIINRITINCARLTDFDKKSCGSVIHKINKILTPPTGTIYDVIKSDPKYSTLMKIMQGTEIEMILQQANSSLTLLAPTDETFAGIDEADLKTLLEDKSKAEMVLKNHILHQVLCCSGVGGKTWSFDNFVQTMYNQSLKVDRTGYDQVRIGRAVVTSCDNLATNGVVHSVNKVLFPQRNRVPNIGGFFILDF